MPKQTSTKKAAKAPADTTSLVSSLNLLRAGMPAADSVVKVWTMKRALTARAKKGAKAAAKAAAFTLRIIRTNEVDGYEEGATPHETLAPSAAKAAKKTSKKSAKKGAGGDNFAGTARKAAKLSISSAPTKTYQDLRNLVNTLPKHEDMVKRKPPVGTTATSNRVKEEERNVKLKTFLYAASREDDNDYHLILGRDPDLNPELYVTMELSGLPPQTAASFVKLKTARAAFKAFFAGQNNLPGKSYDFYDPPIPVEIEGSLFWDANHAKGTRPGPKSLKSRMPTVWEVHPITRIEFNP